MHVSEPFLLQSSFPATCFCRVVAAVDAGVGDGMRFPVAVLEDVVENEALAAAVEVCRLLQLRDVDVRLAVEKRGVVLTSVHIGQVIRV